jgi:hypothetical protein
MKKLIVIALLGSILVGCGNNTENQQTSIGQTYEYSSEYLDSSESNSSEIAETNNGSSETNNDSLGSYSNGLELVYDTIGKPISEFSDSIDMNKFFIKRTSDSRLMVGPFDDKDISIPYNDTYYYFGTCSDKASWEEPSNLTVDYTYLDTSDIKEYLGVDIVVNTDGSNADEVEESFEELWGSPLGTIEFRWEDDYADVYKYNDLYVLALYNVDDTNGKYYNLLVFSNENYLSWATTETQLNKIGLEKLMPEPSRINASDLESVTFQYMDAVFSVDASKVEFYDELLVDNDGTIIVDKYNSCFVRSDSGKLFKFELNFIDEDLMEAFEYNIKEYDNYKHYTSESEFYDYIETDNLTVRVTDELTEKERSELVYIINREFILQ